LTGPAELLLVAGEASGDLHGARLLAELRRRDPGLHAFGLGGDELREAGLEPVAHSSEVAVVGITEVLRVLPRVRQVFRRILAEVDRRGTRTAVLIDFPDFNLRLARKLKQRGVTVIYYISPQVWAWRRGRVRTIARVVDRMLVLFPFELDLYREHGVEVAHVGHPLVDEVPVLPQAWEGGEPEGPYRVALLPGSRLSEVESLLPAMLGAVGLLSKELAVEARIVQAPSIPRQVLEEAVRRSGLPVPIEAADRFATIARSHVALCASGTATLEVGLLGTPLVMVYRLESWTYRLARLLVRLPYVALVNLVLGEKAVPELIQDEARPERIAEEAARLLTDARARGAQRERLARLRERLGAGGASARAAAEVLALARPEAPA
jgi:lipid-A-disaccharide synthase